MTPTEWDIHKRNWCESCTRARKCPIRMMLDKDPEDTWAMSVVRRLGRCSQYKYKTKAKTKK